MNRKYEIAHLIGITRGHEKQFRDAEKVLTKQGYIVLAPVFYTIDEYLSFGECPNMLDDMCYEKLLICDFLVLVTPEHIGKSTRSRIEQAKEFDKTVYIIDDGILKEFHL